jgi:glutamyl-tRNA(Gln) amidotransferase subunit E
MIDYAKLGLKAGLEIHQQLDTSEKLFCRCPARIRDDQPDILVKRKLRASAGEVGVVDVAAAYEQLKNKSFLYRGYNDTTCAVELDEEPIHCLNEEALKVCIQISLMLRARPVDYVLVMRKTVVDGSNTSGFQRTALAAREGTVELLSGKVGIATICVEEDSAKIAERSPEQDTYNLSRLGMPLVEIATHADIKSPEQLREVAEYLGMVLRSTRKVKRGLGTIRQDVNVSIREGARVEIKGAQDLRMLAKIVEYEAMRQQNLAEIAKELQKRKAAVGATSADVTQVLAGSESKLVKETISGRGKVLAIRLKGFAGLVGKELQPGRRLGTEMSEYAKTHGKVTGIIHSDELPKYGITPEETDKIRKALECGKEDAFAFVAAQEKNAAVAIQAASARAKQALKGIPKEVRKANQDGTTTFLRPMPGAARMYPETDAKPVKPSTKGIELPQLLSDVASTYEAKGLSRDLAHAIVKSGAEEFLELMIEENSSLGAPFIAEVIISYSSEMQRRGLDSERIMDSHIKDVLSAVNEGKLAKESVMDALADVAAGQPLNLKKYETMSDAQLEKELKAIISSNANLPLNALIGKAMGTLRGKAPGQKIVEMLKKLKGN